MSLTKVWQTLIGKVYLYHWFLQLSTKILAKTLLYVQSYNYTVMVTQGRIQGRVIGVK